MSEIRANSITDAAGTGAPNFPNGLEVSAGNVGIGTTSPTEELHIYSTNNPIVLLEAGPGTDSRLRLLTANNRIGYIEFGDTDDIDTGEIRYEHSSNAMIFATNGNVDRMTLDASGNLTLSGRLTAGYTSSEVTLSRDYSATFAHGLGARPSRIQMNLRCASAQLGYAVNDVVYFSGGAYDINSGQGINIAADATNIYFGTYWVYVRNRSGGSGAFVEITYANWQASMVAWR
jgi:hypothetical protein